MMESNNLKHLFMVEPTYSSSDRYKLPALVDFCVTKGIPQDFAVAKSRFDLSSDHSPLFIKLTADGLNQENEPILRDRHTNWDDFRRLSNRRWTLNIPLRTEEDTEAAVKFFNDTIQYVGWNAMSEHKRTLKAYDCPIII
jgi:hypothetical protein